MVGVGIYFLLNGYYWWVGLFFGSLGIGMLK